jgi:hypothetical protein
LIKRTQASSWELKHGSHLTSTVQRKKPKNSECVFAKLKLGRNTSIIIGSIYRPPSSDLSCMNNLCESIEHLHNENRNTVFWIGGDLNLPGIQCRLEPADIRG